VSAWVTQNGVPCLTGLFAHAVMATLWFCRALLGDLWASAHSVKHLCFVQDGF
jgi:hypothetical protein